MGARPSCCVPTPLTSPEILHVRVCIHGLQLDSLANSLFIFFVSLFLQVTHVSACAGPCASLGILSEVQVCSCALSKDRAEQGGSKHSFERWFLQASKLIMPRLQELCLCE